MEFKTRGADVDHHVLASFLIPSAYLASVFLPLFLLRWYAESKNEAARQASASKDIDIIERIGEAGSLDGKPIAKFIKLADGRTFEFVSLAVKLPNGTYSSDDPEVAHVKIDDNLLYKLVSDQER